MPCDFGLKSRNLWPGSNASFVLDTDWCDVESHRAVEVGVRGPDPATTLAVVSGIAVPNVDVDATVGRTLDDWKFELYILTDYKLDTPSQFVDGGAYVWLDAITDDDRWDRTAGELYWVDVQPKVDGRIQLHVGGSIQGDMSLARLGYQAFVVSSKPRPVAVTHLAVLHGSERISLDRLLRATVHTLEGNR